MQPLHYDLRCPAAKDTSITHTASAPSNLDPGITMRSSETERKKYKRTTRKNVSKTTPEAAAPLRSAESAETDLQKDYVQEPRQNHA